MLQGDSTDGSSPGGVGTRVRRAGRDGRAIGAGAGRVVGIDIGRIDGGVALMNGRGRSGDVTRNSPGGGLEAGDEAHGAHRIAVLSVTHGFVLSR